MYFLSATTYPNMNFIPVCISVSMCLVVSITVFHSSVHFPIGFCSSSFSNSFVSIAIHSHLFMFLRSFFYHRGDSKNPFWKVRLSVSESLLYDSSTKCTSISWTLAIVFIYFSPLTIAFSPLLLFLSLSGTALTVDFVVFCFLVSFFVRSRIVAVRSLATNSGSVSRKYLFS